MSVAPTAVQLRIRDTEALGMLVTAPAGCGKTEALALRVQGMIRRGVAGGGRKILVATFSNRAKDNIRERLRAYLLPSEMRDKVAVLNFHGLSARLYKSHAGAIGLDPGWTLPENNWVREQCQRIGLVWGQISGVERVLQHVKLEAVDDAGVIKQLLAIGNLDAIRIEKQRRDEEQLSYDDLPRLAELILANDGVAALYQEHFAAVVIDEFQDLTPQQLRIINRIGEGRTTYAGDLAQGIYGFTGARPADVFAQISAEVTVTVKLTESHRSAPAVLAAVNALSPLTESATLTSADPASWPSGGVASLLRHGDADLEAKWVVQFAEAVISRTPSHRIGIISRTAARRRFVDSAIAATDLEFHRWDDGVLDTETARRVRGLLSAINPAAVLAAKDPIEFLREAAQFHEIQDPADRTALADALSWVLVLLTDGTPPADVVRRIRVGDNSTLLTKPGVHLLSGHVGKGQQFDWVVVAGVEEDVLPFFEAKTPEAVQEEARVLSVMMSRARHGVVLSFSASVPTLAGKPRGYSPSRFLTPDLRAVLKDDAQLADWFGAADWASIASR